MAALALVALFAFQRVSDMDAGWLLALGREIAEGRFPRTNTLSWTAPDHPWYPTNWLFDFLLFGAQRIAGVFGMQLLVFLLASGALALAMLAARRAGASASSAGVAALLAVGVFWTRISPRPHLFEYLLGALALERAAAALARRSARPLWALPPAVLVWANGHQSAPFGLAVAGLVLLPFARDVLRWDRRERRSLVLVFVLAGAALFATPAGAANLLDLFAHLSIGKVLPVQEYARPSPAGEPYLWVFGAVSLVAAAAAPRRAAPLLLFVAMTFVLGRRFGGDMAVLSIPPIALALDRLGAARTSRARAGAFLAGLVAALALLALARVPVTELGGYLGASWEPARLPVEAVEQAKRLGLGRGGFTAYRFGGYVAWQMPHAGDFQDGRIRAWPPEFWHELVAATSDPASFRRYLDRAGASWALVSAHPEPLSGYGLLRDAPGWRRVHSDDTAELYVRAAP